MDILYITKYSAPVILPVYTSYYVYSDFSIITLEKKDYCIIEMTVNISKVQAQYQIRLNIFFPYKNSKRFKFLFYNLYMFNRIIISTRICKYSQIYYGPKGIKYLVEDGFTLFYRVKINFDLTELFMHEDKINQKSVN
jgi:hypothetical protein